MVNLVYCQIACKTTMSDLIDVLTETGLRTGEILPRSEIHRLGKRHRAVHLYLFNWENELLLQKRSITVDHFPGMYSISLTGHVASGEFSKQTLRRELTEELGPGIFQFHYDFMFSFFQEATLSETYIDRQFNDVYVAHADITLEQIAFDRSEVSEIKYVPFAQFQEMVANKSGGIAPVYASECRDLVYFLSKVK